MDLLLELTRNPRVTVRRDGAPDSEGACVVYWMQRAQRGVDNPALDVAVEAANALRQAGRCLFCSASVSSCQSSTLCVPGTGDSGYCRGVLEKRNIGFVLRRFPDHSLLKFCEEVRPALVVGDENPIRQARGWRETVVKKLRIPLWTVDADVIVPSKLLEKEQYAAFIIRPRLQAQLKQFLVAIGEPKGEESHGPKPRT